jgi:hypothetical protein
MTPVDRERFLKIVVGFAELKGKVLSASALEVYWRAMQAWPLADFEAAAALLVKATPFMPTPYDFEKLRKAGRPTAGEAWAQARAACGSCYTGGHLGPGGTCGDEFIDRAVRAIGGYRAIAVCDMDKLHFLERRFAEHYETLRDADDVREALPQIAAPAAAQQLTDERA